MKTKSMTYLVIPVLWLGSLIGAYQIGRSQNAIQAAADPRSTTAAGSNTRAPSRAHGGMDASDRNGQRSADKAPTVKQLLAQLRDTMRPGSMQNPMSMMRAMGILDKLRPEDVPEALLEAESMNDIQSKMMIYMPVLGKWAEQDGPAAMKYAEDHAKELGPTGMVLKMTVVSAWAENDPNAVWAWYQANKGKDSGGIFGGNEVMVSNIFSSLMNTDPDAAFKRLDDLDPRARMMALEGISQTAMFDDSKRQALLDRIASMPDAAERSQARQTLVSQWVMFAPDEATAWIGRQPAEDQKDLRSSLGSSLMMTDPKMGAALMMEGATEEEKPTRYATVVGSWASMNPADAASWLAEQGDGPELDMARGYLADSFFRVGKNAAAMDHVRAITDANQRFQAANSIYQQWQAKDSAAADAGLNNSGLSTDQVQQIRSSAGK